jgi:hypothetical protein
LQWMVWRPLISTDFCREIRFSWSKELIEPERDIEVLSGSHGNQHIRLQGWKPRRHGINLYAVHPVTLRNPSDKQLT